MILILRNTLRVKEWSLSFFRLLTGRNIEHDEVVQNKISSEIYRKKIY